MIEAKELQQKEVGEIEKLLTEKRRDLWNFRFGTTGGKTRNVKEGVTLRRDIARILTILRKKKTKKHE